MKGLFNKISTIREVFSLENEEPDTMSQDAEDILDELVGKDEKQESNLEAVPVEKVKSEEKILDFGTVKKSVGKEDDKSGIESIMKYQTIFVKPTRFEESKKVANYINQDKIVTVNLEEVESRVAQRIIDFLSGAMSVKEAQFVEVSKRIYVAVPKKIHVLVDGSKRIGKDENITFDFGVGN